MKQAYQVCIKVCPVWKDIYAAPERSRKNIQHKNGFLYVQNLKKQQRLVLPITFTAKNENFLEIAIAEAHAATPHGVIEKTMKALTDKFAYLCFSHLVREYVGSYDICQRMKYSQKGPIENVTALHVPGRSCSDITMDFLKLSPIFNKGSVLYPNIPVGEDQIACIARL